MAFGFIWKERGSRNYSYLMHHPRLDLAAAGTFWAEAELELVRARAVMEAVLTRAGIAGITAERNGGPEQGTALIHVLPKLQKLEPYERRGILQAKASATGSPNRHGLREKHMYDCLKLNLGSFCHFDEERLTWISQTPSVYVAV
jgi:hypothetical protein